MLKNTILLGLVVLFANMAFAQTAAVKPTVKLGEVVTIAPGKIVIKADTGEIEAVLSDKTEYKRVSAEKPSLATATPAALTDIAVGDKVMVTGILAADGKSVPARAVYLMTKADISQKHEKEKQEWRTRGIAGKVATVNPQTNQITVEVRGMIGNMTPVTVTPKADAKFKRYAPDSIKYDEAKDSTLAELQAGDMIRVLGDKNTEGTSMAAEQLVSGAFQTIAGTVKSIDAAKGEVVITELQNSKDVTVVAGEASVMKRFPAETAERMAGAQNPAGGARPVGQGGARPAGGQAQPAAGNQGATRVMVGPGGPGMRPGGGGGLDEMIERFPNITVADLKVGDMIAISSTKNGSTERIKAIKLLAGVEPFIRMAQMAAAAGGRRGGGGVDFNIPGLDGIGFP
jgi:hypothetical protein